MKQTFTMLALLLTALGAHPSCAEEAPDRHVDQVVTVTLSGGSRITAALLRQNDQGVVLDLGDDIISIRADQILGIQKPESESTQDRQDFGYFTVGRLNDAPLSDLVRRYGDAVVIVKTPAGLGSGFIISTKGHMITNYHVIEGTSNIAVTAFQRGDEGYQRRQIKRVKILAMQPLRDLALLQIDHEVWKDLAIRPLVIARDQSLRVGDMVFTIGNPLGLERSVTQGIVSSTTRTMGHLRFLQTDASINPGNSGGPLFNARGEVVGVVCAGFVMFDGLAFGIPAVDLIEFLKHRDAYLYDSAQPQNGITYLPPPYRPHGEGEPDRDGPGAATAAPNIPKDKD